MSILQPQDAGDFKAISEYLLGPVMSLKDGWDGFFAVKPSDKAICTAMQHLPDLVKMNIYPDIKPDPLGGLYLIYMVQDRKHYTEIMADGRLGPHTIL